MLAEFALSAYADDEVRVLKRKPGIWEVSQRTGNPARPWRTVAAVVTRERAYEIARTLEAEAAERRLTLVP